MKGITRPNPESTFSTRKRALNIPCNWRDFEVARDQHWYRVPLRSAPKRWPPAYLAFYQTKVFGDEKWRVNYYARVIEIKTVSRRELLPEESDHPRAEDLYYQVFIEPLRRLPQLILSRRWRRIVFIPTTWDKFISAVEINDLYDESPLEDRLWAELKRPEIAAERQFYIKAKDRHYALDFAIFCDEGKIDVETDGDT